MRRSIPIAALAAVALVVPCSLTIARGEAQAQQPTQYAPTCDKKPTEKDENEAHAYFTIGKKAYDEADYTKAIDNLRSAADRVQGAKDSHKARNMVLFTGIVVGVLFNPVTGPATREWLKGLVGGGESADFDEPSSNNGS